MLSAEENIVCVKELQHILATIQKVPQARTLISNVLKEGPIRITINTHLPKEFGAYWEGNQRIIVVNYNNPESELIDSIIFELHNALANTQLNHFDYLASSGQMTRNQYIESIERLEYSNAHLSKKIMERGVQMGVFPKNARLQLCATFEEHFRIQKKYGHSEWIGKNYDDLVPRGNRRFTASR